MEIVIQYRMVKTKDSHVITTLNQIRNVLENKKIANILNLLTQFGGVEKLKTELKAVLMAA